MVDFVEGLWKIHHNDVSLLSTVEAVKDFLGKTQQLSFATTFRPETMLEGTKDIMIIKESHHIWDNDIGL